MGTAAGGWLALPDRAAAARLPGIPDAVVDHPSGRPWLVGDLTRGGVDRVVAATAGDVTLVVVGATTATAEWLRAWAGRVNSLSDVDEVAARLHGSVHLLASIGGRVRVQGSVSGVRAVAYARIDGITVAADRADPLAALTGAGVDEVGLAACLLPISSAALTGSVWRGVRLLATDSWLELDRAGHERVVRWWSPPEPRLGLAEGAARLRHALDQAVRARVGPGGHAGADLSGGLDSTPLCFLAADAVAGGGLTTVRVAVADRAHDDHVWAARAARSLPGNHHVFGGADMPGMFAEVGEPVSGVDEPVRWIRSVARLRFTAGWLAERGAGAHLTGHGGDEILVPKPNYLHDLSVRRPALVARRFTALRAGKRWSLTAGLRELGDRAPYRRWLLREADRLTDAFPAPATPMFGWEYPLRMPPWAAPEATAAVAARLREAAARAEPLGADRSTHLALTLARQVGAAVRQAGQVTAATGVPPHAPYLDDRVIEACLAVRPEERGNPWRYKPLTAEAMRDRMPPESLSRGTKGEFSDDLQRGLHRHRDQVAALFDDPMLARLGLVEPDRLRRAALSAYPIGLPMAALDTAMSVENWLRATVVRPAGANRVA
ncbi:asparagine synthase-related protein [Actinokineospora iranica]|uniref:Asparagine synthase (Glutamine-hydrolysing) n=1 Tax=Actinokineospora iranica TaxID=1271860 RepID=A0A1G6U6B3_9PSEU|nr:asparagine synthase-related protein [Actinokineospora iranica]SDD36226.1 asparagine synthase (glutamine-hydrolysing) [Actinokineospora iranica]